MLVFLQSYLHDLPYLVPKLPIVNYCYQLRQDIICTELFQWLYGKVIRWFVMLKSIWGLNELCKSEACWLYTIILYMQLYRVLDILFHKYYQLFPKYYQLFLFTVIFWHCSYITWNVLAVSVCRAAVQKKIVSKLSYV